MSFIGRRLFLMILLGFFLIGTISGISFTSTPTGGDYNASASWSGGQSPKDSYGWGENLDVNIVDDASITRNGDLQLGGNTTNAIHGAFSIVGSLSTGGNNSSLSLSGAIDIRQNLVLGWSDRLFVNGMVVIDGSVSGNASVLTIKSGASVHIKGGIGDNISVVVEEGATFIVDGASKANVDVSDNGNVNLGSTTGGKIIVNGGGEIDVVGDCNGVTSLDVLSGGVFNVAGSFISVSSNTFVNNGEFNVGNGLIVPNFTNNGVLHVSGDINVSGSFINTGTIDVIGGVQTPNLTNNGNLHITELLNVSGSLINKGTIDVDDAFNGHLVVESGAVVRVKSFSGGTFNVKNGGTLIIEDGDCTLTNHSSIEKNGRVEIYGDLNLKSNIETKAGSVLIVNGSMNATGNWGMNIAGDVVVSEDFSVTNGSIANNGNFVVGGDFTHAGGGFGGTSSDNFYIIDANPIISPSGFSQFGNMDHFVTNEGNNDVLWDLVQQTMPEYLVAVKQWLGYTSDWNAKTNWKSNKVPDKNTNVIITDPGVTGRLMPIISSGSFEVRSLSIASSASLTIDGASALIVNQNMSVSDKGFFVVKPGSKVTVLGNLANINDEGGTSVVIENTVLQPSSFLVSKNIAAPVMVKWRYPVAKYIAIGHCVEGNLFSNYNVADQTFIYRLVNNKWSVVSNSTGFNDQASMGYYVAYKDAVKENVEVSHTGMLRQGAYTYTMGDTWELIGNPYSTYLDVKSADFNINGAYNTVYVPQMGLGRVNFATYNIGSGVGASGGSQYIAPGQGFYIRSDQAGTLFQLGANARTHGDGAALKSLTAEDDVLRFVLSTETVSDEQVLLFRSFGSDQFSTNYDSEKRFLSDDLEVALYTIKDGHKLIINALPEDIIGRQIPLFMNIGAKSAGGVVLKATNLTRFKNEVNVYLTDLNSGDVMNLRDTPEYAFQADAGTEQQRFLLSFGKDVNSAPQSATSINNSTPVNETAITAMAIGSNIVVNVKDPSFKGDVNIEVLDIHGKLHHQLVSHTEISRLSFPVDQSVLIVKVIYKGEVKNFKIMHVR